LREKDRELRRRRQRRKKRLKISNRESIQKAAKARSKKEVKTEAE